MLIAGSPYAATKNSLIGSFLSSGAPAEAVRESCFATVGWASSMDVNSACSAGATGELSSRSGGNLVTGAGCAIAGCLQRTGSAMQILLLKGRLRTRRLRCAIHGAAASAQRGEMGWGPGHP